VAQSKKFPVRVNSAIDLKNTQQLELRSAPVESKNQLDATCYFIVLLIGSTCFEHYYAHHQELETMMMFTTLVVSFLVCCMLEVRCG